MLVEQRSIKQFTEQMNELYYEIPKCTAYIPFMDAF